jgi:hypothetical protein
MKDFFHLILIWFLLDSAGAVNSFLSFLKLASTILEVVFFFGGGFESKEKYKKK